MSKKAEEYLKEIWLANMPIHSYHKEGETKYLADVMQSYADQQLKAKMPSEQEIEKAFGMMLTRTENDQNFDSGVKEGIKWLKQQIEK